MNPGTVSHELFDHLSIIKTILVRHRDRFYADQFERFVSRVKNSNHIGAALNRDDARPGEPVMLPAPPRRGFSRRTVPAAIRPGPPRRRPTDPPEDEEEARDFRLSLARAMLPKRR